MIMLTGSKQYYLHWYVSYIISFDTLNLFHCNQFYTTYQSNMKEYIYTYTGTPMYMYIEIKKYTLNSSLISLANLIQARPWICFWDIIMFALKLKQWLFGFYGLCSEFPLLTGISHCWLESLQNKMLLLTQMRLSRCCQWLVVLTLVW